MYLALFLICAVGGIAFFVWLWSLKPTIQPHSIDDDLRFHGLRPESYYLTEISWTASIDEPARVNLSLVDGSVHLASQSLLAE